ncbi:MAG TPA: hypothetical protein VF624_03030 [Tepidisphaeraceae bacterium]|jgi:hypothetical protein
MPDIATIPTPRAIARYNRGLLVSRVTRMALLTAVVCGSMLQLLGRPDVGALLVIVAVMVWTVLTVRTAKVQQELSLARGLLEAGRPAEAEHAIDLTLERFCLQSRPRVAALHLLATLRFTQHRFRESAQMLSRLLERARGDASILRAMRLMLAEAALEYGDVHTAFTALSGAMTGELSVRERLKVMELQIEYCTRIAAWPQVVDGLAAKIELAELLPAEPAARVQALMALALSKLGRHDWSNWLLARVRLLFDAEPLIERRPVLRDLLTQPHE